MFTSDIRYRSVGRNPNNSVNEQPIRLQDCHHRPRVNIPCPKKSINRRASLPPEKTPSVVDGVQRHRRLTIIPSKPDNQKYANEQMTLHQCKLEPSDSRFSSNIDKGADETAYRRNPAFKDAEGTDSFELNVSIREAEVVRPLSTPEDFYRYYPLSNPRRQGSFPVQEAENYLVFCNPTPNSYRTLWMPKLTRECLIYMMFTNS